MIILAIDTSCDDTSISAIEAQNSKIKILSNIISSQVKVHQKYGGVYPTLAKREHQKNLPRVLKKALKQAGLLKIFNFQTLKKSSEKSRKPGIDAIAVTVGPGLEPCLWTGVNFAKNLAQVWKLPVVPVNHIESHILANFIDGQKIEFPAICLVVSGGHTQLILMKGVGKYKIIGETRDDAAGECFDKTARVLGLSYPGGPEIAAEARGQTSTSDRGLPSVSLPRPMMHSKDYDFSFSGLKTAVLYHYQKQPKKVRESKAYIRAMAKEIQQAIIDVLIKKTSKAAKDHKAKSIILGGGVTANNELRKQFNHKLQTTNYKLNFLVPPKNLCTDNAAMIGATAYFHRKNALNNWNKLEAKANLRINEANF